MRMCTMCTKRFVLMTLYQATVFVHLFVINSKQILHLDWKPAMRKTNDSWKRFVSKTHPNQQFMIIFILYFKDSPRTSQKLILRALKGHKFLLKAFFFESVEFYTSTLICSDKKKWERNKEKDHKDWFYKPRIIFYDAFTLIHRTCDDFTNFQHRPSLKQKNN